MIKSSETTNAMSEARTTLAPQSGPIVETSMVSVGRLSSSATWFATLEASSAEVVAVRTRKPGSPSALVGLDRGVRLACVVERIAHLLDGHVARTMEGDRRAAHEFDTEVQAAHARDNKRRTISTAEMESSTLRTPRKLMSCLMKRPRGFAAAAAAAAPSAPARAQR